MRNWGLFLAIACLAGMMQAAQAQTVPVLGDGGPATKAYLNYPVDVAVDAAGNLYIADRSNRIRKVEAATGIITTIAGGGKSRDDGIPGTQAYLQSLSYLALDHAGGLLFAEVNSSAPRVGQPGIELFDVVHRLDLRTGLLTTVAGGGLLKLTPGQSLPARKVQLTEIGGITVDAADNLYVAVRSGIIYGMDRQTGKVVIVAGTGERGYTGDGGPALQATFNEPTGIIFDARGNLYVADSNNYAVRKIDGATGIISTVVELRKHTGQLNNPRQPKPEQHAVTAPKGFPADMRGIGLEANGHLLITSDRAGYLSRVDLQEGQIGIIAGDGWHDGGWRGRYAGDGKPALQASFWQPTSVCVDAQGNIFIADTLNHCIRRIDAETGIVSTVAGCGGLCEPLL